MASTVPGQLREAQIGQFARRAAQLERFKPIITYWLRFYMTQKIISKGLHTADSECTAYTTDLMEKLERTKAEHANEDAILDDLAAYAYCEQFALQTFSKGDNEIRTNKVTESTADTLLAASTFLELLSIWKDPPEAEIKSKMTYAKYHAVRIAKAIKSGEDPNLSNPKLETPPANSPPRLDPNDPEVQNISGTGAQSVHNTYQPYVESAPNTSAQPSPTFSATTGRSPPPNMPPIQTGHNESLQSTFSSHQDVSPISQPATSRQGSVVSVGGGYFPNVDVPTFTAETAPAAMPTAPTLDDQTMDNPYNASEPPTAPSLPTSHVAEPQSYYQPQSSSSFPQPGPKAPPAHTFPASPVPQPNPYSHPPQPTQSQSLQQAPNQSPAGMPQSSSYQGPFNTDEDSILEAQKHAKWAISALNFEDVNTAVKELRTALQSLGAR